MRLEEITRDTMPEGGKESKNKIRDRVQTGY
jgi:hypothetical protein